MKSGLKKVIDLLSYKKVVLNIQIKKQDYPNKIRDQHWLNYLDLIIYDVKGIIRWETSLEHRYHTRIGILNVLMDQTRKGTIKWNILNAEAETLKRVINDIERLI